MALQILAKPQQDYWKTTNFACICCDNLNRNNPMMFKIFQKVECHIFLLQSHWWCLLLSLRRFPENMKWKFYKVFCRIFSSIQLFQQTSRKLKNSSNHQLLINEQTKDVCFWDLRGCRVAKKIAKSSMFLEFWDMIVVFKSY